MDLEDIKRGLRAEIKKRENETYATFQCNVRQMCKDVLAKLEEQESVIAELNDKLRHYPMMVSLIESDKKEIRRLNGPETEIICALGSMNYYLYPEIEQAVRTLREQTGDRRIHSFRYRPMAPLDGYGAAGHPSGTTQRKMGQELADFIRSL